VVQAEQPAKPEEPLTDADMEAIQNENNEHTKRFGMTVKQYYLLNKKEK
jgi:hypothetical protein